MSEIILSIIVPIYNTELYLCRCIDSLLAQDIDRANYEILLINDGSTDGSQKIAEEYTYRYQNIKLINKENGGLSSTRNVGIENVRGKYFLHVDSDDFIEKNVLGSLIDKAEYYKAELLFFRGRTCPDKGKVLNVQPFKLNTIFTGRDILLGGMMISSSWSNLYLSSFVRSVGISFYGRISHQDVEYNYRLYPHAKRVVFTDDIIYCYYIESESISRPKSESKRQKLDLDNVDVAANVILYYNNIIDDSSLKHYGVCQMNSILVSMLFAFIKQKKVNISFVDKFLDYATSRGVYPIKGKTSSWKTSLLIPILNVRWLYMLLVKL